MSMISKAKHEVAEWICENTKPQTVDELEIFSQMCDNLKDLAEADYYCKIVEAMNNPEHGKEVLEDLKNDFNPLKMMSEITK